MKKIKFRAWNKDLNTNGGMVWNVAVLNGKYFDVYGMGTQDYPLMQYTGLKDKNGVDIYEEDILKYINLKNEETIIQVWWDAKDSCFNFGNRNLSMIKNKLEVIGNIYENPEIIEKK